MNPDDPRSPATVQRPGVSAALGHVCTLLLTLTAVGFDIFTFAANDYGPILASAIACALTASALIVVLWSRAPTLGRVVLCLCALANLWVLVDGVRRLGA